MPEPPRVADAKHRPFTLIRPGALTAALLSAALWSATLASPAWAGTADPGAAPPPDDAPAALFDETLAEPPSTAAAPRARARRVGGSWIAQGPGPTRFGQTENVSPDDEVTGAIHSAAAHPTDPDILYAAGANGGVWKTFDATSASPTWTPLADDQASTSIGALELDPADPDIVIVGHGRPSSFGGAGGKKNGILYSTNGGNAWTVIDDPLLVDENISGVAARGATLVAVSRDSSGGLFRSTDTGATWSELSGDGSSGLPAGDSDVRAGRDADPFVSDDDGASGRHVRVHVAPGARVEVAALRTR